jgi:hypothetical protein
MSRACPHQDFVCLLFVLGDSQSAILAQTLLERIPTHRPRLDGCHV